MRRYNPAYFIGQAFKGMWRNGMMTLASIVVLFSCLVVMGCFGMLVININNSLKKIDDLNRIYVFVDSDVSYHSDETVNLSPAPETSDGETAKFLGWSTDPTSATAEYSASGAYTVDPADANGDLITLYAVWDSKPECTSYTVRYSSYGKKIQGAVADDTVCKSGDSVIVSDALIPFFSADTFLGWSLTPGAEKAEFGAGEEYVIDAKDAKGGVITFYAVWNGASVFEEYNIKYEMNGVSVKEIPTDNNVRLNSVKGKLTQVKGISNIEFISKQETLESEKESFVDYPGLLDLLENIKTDENPYPDTYVLTYDETASVSDIEAELELMEGQQTISGYKCRVDIANKISNLKNGVVLVFTWFMAILLIVSVFVIINTIKLAVVYRSKEITIMRYIGATKRFIAMPFEIEGIIIGLLSGGIAYFIDWLVYHYIETNMQMVQMIEPIPFDDLKMIMLVGSIIVGAITGFLGSVISIRKYLKA